MQNSLWGSGHYVNCAVSVNVKLTTLKIKELIHMRDFYHNGRALVNQTHQAKPRARHFLAKLRVHIQRSQQSDEILRGHVILSGAGPAAHLS